MLQGFQGMGVVLVRRMALEVEDLVEREVEGPLGRLES